MEYSPLINCVAGWIHFLVDTDWSALKLTLSSYTRILIFVFKCLNKRTCPPKHYSMATDCRQVGELIALLPPLHRFEVRRWKPSVHFAAPWTCFKVMWCQVSADISVLWSKQSVLGNDFHLSCAQCSTEQTRWYFSNI